MVVDSGQRRDRAITILTAMQLEAKAVATALGMTRPRPGRPAVGAIGNLHITLHLIGIGAVGLKGIELDPSPDCVIMAGVAGALDPRLRVGEVVIAGDGRISGKHGHRAAIHTTAAMVSTARAKAELFASTGAAAVDMETGIVEQWAREQGIAFVAVRAISDAARQEIDPRVLTLVDQWGRPRLAAVAGSLLRRPWLVPPLIRLGRDSALAAQKLGMAVREILRELSEGASNNR